MAIIAGFGTCFTRNATAVERQRCRSSFIAARWSRLPRDGRAALAQVTALYPPCGPYLCPEAPVEAVESVRKG